MDEFIPTVVNDFPLDIRPGEREPRVLDESIAAGLDCSPSEVRKGIRRLVSRGFLNASELREEFSETAGRPVGRYRLTEAQAYIVATQARGPKAAALTRQMAAVFTAWRRGQLPAPAQIDAARDAARLDAARALIGDGDLRDAHRLAKECKSFLVRLAEIEGTSFNKAHGALRREFGVVSYLRVRLNSYQLVREFLIERLTTVPLSPALLAARTPQMPLFSERH